MSSITTINLAQLGFDLNAALDRGNNSDITVDDIYEKIEDGTILDFLRTDIKVDLSVWTDEKCASLLAHWQSLHNVADASRKFGVRNSGLCLLLAYVLEGLQNGTGGF